MLTHIKHRLPLLAILGLLTVAASSWVQGYTTNGVKWPGSSVSYYVNPSSVWVSPNAAVSAVQTAAAGWNEQTQANIELAYAGTTNGSSLTLNYKNEVFFRNSTNGGNLAEIYWWADGSGRLVDGDMVFWEGQYRYFAGSGCSQGLYIENIGIHEFGHILGLGHSAQSAATMWPSSTSWCDRSWLTLEADDIAGLEQLYPPSAGGGPPSNTPPSVSISSPGSSLSVSDTTSITFTGSASDGQDGNLTSSLRWTSNLVGQIGTGGSLARTLPAGAHAITATATDTAGLSSSQQVTVLVSTSGQPPSSGASLSARGYKVKGAQKVDLTWSGLSASMTDVFRDTTKVATVPNNGAATDAINKKGGGTYQFKVCEANTSTCSNLVQVTF